MGSLRDGVVRRFRYGGCEWGRRLGTDGLWILRRISRMELRISEVKATTHIQPRNDFEAGRRSR
jgi:hypothetical protein